MRILTNMSCGPCNHCGGRLELASDDKETFIECGSCHCQWKPSWALLRWGSGCSSRRDLVLNRKSRKNS